MNGKQILITTESREVFIVRRTGHEMAAGFCPVCNEILISTSPDAITSDAGAIDLGPRHLLICARSGPAAGTDTKAIT